MMIYYLLDYSKIFEVFDDINFKDDGCCIFIQNIDKLKEYYKKIDYDRHYIYPEQYYLCDYDYLCYCDYDYLKTVKKDHNILILC